MKSYKNLYTKLCSFDNLLLAFRKAKKGKSKKLYIKEFESNLGSNLLRLKLELETLTYKPKPLKRFVIRDPKTRIIHASNFRDRVVHHALCNIIEPVFERIFIYDSYANRKKKGVHVALKRFDKFKRKISRNGRLTKDAKDNNMIKGYILKADIKHYFNSVDHKILIRIIKRRISDENVLWLTKQILNNHDFKISGKGMPIGNLTSQFFANVYLNELDYFVKHRLKAKCYLRYVDDFAIVHKSKDILLYYKEEINKFLKTLNLELHTDKSKIFPMHRGTKLLGFRVLYYYKLPKKSNVTFFYNRLTRVLDNKQKFSEAINGWFAYAMWGNTYRLRAAIQKLLT